MKIIFSDGRFRNHLTKAQSSLGQGERYPGEEGSRGSDLRSAHIDPAGALLGSRSIALVIV